MMFTSKEQSMESSFLDWVIWVELNPQGIALGCDGGWKSWSTVNSMNDRISSHPTAHSDRVVLTVLL